MKLNTELVVLITGGAQGLGAATARHLCARGCKVAIADLKEEKLDKLVNELGKDNCYGIKCDVTDHTQVQSAVQETVRKFGSLHVALTCAGIVTESPLLDTRTGESLDLDKFHKTVSVNLFGSVYTAKYAAQAMANNTPTKEKGERGCIIFTSSICAFEAHPKLTAYSATKAALGGITLPIARDVSHAGIRCLAIAPGPIYTEMSNEWFRLQGCDTDEKIETMKKDIYVRYAPEDMKFAVPGDFATMVESCISNPLLNGTNIRLDGGIRM